KLRLLLAIGQADNVVDLRLSLNAAQFHSLPADVCGEDFLGKNLPAAIRPENADGDFDFLAGLAAFAHNLARFLEYNCSRQFELILLHTPSGPQVTDGQPARAAECRRTREKRCKTLHEDAEALGHSDAKSS